MSLPCLGAGIKLNLCELQHLPIRNLNLTGSPNLSRSMDTASDTCLWPCGYWHILVSSCSASTRDLEKLDITQTATVNRPLDQSEVSIGVSVECPPMRAHLGWSTSRSPPSSASPHSFRHSRHSCSSARAAWTHAVYTRPHSSQH